eukprot:6135035-Prymnesium_polylepis.1
MAVGGAGTAVLGTRSPGTIIWVVEHGVLGATLRRARSKILSLDPAAALLRHPCCMHAGPVARSHVPACAKQCRIVARAGHITQSLRVAPTLPLGGTMEHPRFACCMWGPCLHAMTSPCVFSMASWMLL